MGRTPARTLVTLVICAAGLGAPAGPLAYAESPQPLVMLTVNNMNHVPEFAGVERGIFVQHGVDLKLRVMNAGSEVLRAFQAGQAQLLNLSPTVMAVAFNSGLHLVAVVGVMGDATRVSYDDVFAITARAGSGIRRLHVEDLVGRRVGMVIGGTGEAYLRAVLARHGIPAEKVQFVNVPAPNHVSVLRVGGVDAEVTWEPYGTMILQQVPGSYVVLRGGGYIGYNLYVGSSQEFVARNPEIIQRVVDGFVEAEWWVRHHPSEAAQIATRWIEGLDLRSAQKAITYMNFDPRFSRNTLTAATLEQQALLSLRRIKEGMDFTQALDTRFLAEAMRREPQFFSDLKPVR